ncbi:MAG: ubiquinone-binding protein [Rhodospirillaceae bacterium]|nr:ubiquinone-binding protein [Rhodospirillaceae bacterium]|tara:strand:+ start:797 stop:1231 length:435 start_codon:yes stop_codon:yes gene_type:complete
MPSYKESTIMGYNQTQIFNLVADIESYPEFLPWCLGSRVTKHSDTIIEATLIVGFQLVREKFGSRVHLDRPNYTIKTEHTHGPFNYLINSWQFKEHQNGCEVDFFLDFEFRSPILKKLMTTIFADAVKKMNVSFKERAESLYGN